MKKGMRFIAILLATALFVSGVPMMNEASSAQVASAKKTKASVTVSTQKALNQALKKKSQKAYDKNGEKGKLQNQEWQLQSQDARRQREKGGHRQSR